MTQTLTIRKGQIEDLDRLHEIEFDNFGPEVAMAKEVMAQRLKKNSDLFLVACFGEQIAGYIEGPLVPEADLLDTYYQGLPEAPSAGGYVAVTSLSIDAAFQGQGLGTSLLAVLKDLVVAKDYQGIVLTCQEHLVSYYELNGFSDMGPSASQLGHLPWIKMVWQVPS